MRTVVDFSIRFFIGDTTLVNHLRKWFRRQPEDTATVQLPGPAHWLKRGLWPAYGPACKRLEMQNWRGIEGVLPVR
jgi:hypothetical protein